MNAFGDLLGLGKGLEGLDGDNARLVEDLRFRLRRAREDAQKRFQHELRQTELDAILF